MIKAYEEMLESIKAFEAAQGADNGQLAAADAEVDQARQRYNALLEKAFDNQELAAELAQAQGMVTIAETKLQRLQTAINDPNRYKYFVEVGEGENKKRKPVPKDMVVAFQNVQAEIRRRIADGSLLREEFQPLLDEMAGHRKSYLEKLAAVLAKMNQVNKSLAHVQHSTASAVLRYTDKEERFGLGPEQVTESDFKEWAWTDHYQYANDLAAIRKAALEETSPEAKLPPAYHVLNAITPESENFQKGNQL